MRGSPGAKRQRTNPRAAWASIAALVISTAALAAPSPATAGAPADAHRATDQVRTASALRALVAGRGGIESDPTSGAVTFVSFGDGQPIGPADDDPGSASRAFVDRYGQAFGVDDPAMDLVESRRTESLSGVSVRYQQQQDGVPVLGGDVVVAVDADGHVLASTAKVSPAPEVTTTPTISATSAVATAISLTSRDGDVASADLIATTPSLWIYDPALLHASGLPTVRLVWRIEVRNAAGDVDRFVLIDARSGRVALQFSQVAHVKDREVCDNANTPGASPVCTAPVLAEGGDAAAANTEVRHAYEFAGATYDFYLDVLGRDSIDGQGMTLVSTVRHCTLTSCPYENAYWDGSQMVYGDGYASGLDVVAHELTHGVTQFSSDLLYYGESGAINESMSDVIGEIIELVNSPASDPDQLAWLQGEDIPGLGAVRSMSDPTAFGDPDRMTSPLYVGSAVDHHGVHANSGVSNKAAYLMAMGGVFNGRNMGAGIGLTKTAMVYYEAQASLLALGSDYSDLANVLPQACAQLQAGGEVTGPDCAIVAQAVAATEMALEPTAPGASLHQPPCDTGKIVTSTVFSDGIQTGAPGWSTAGTVAGAQWTFGAARSADLALFGPDLPITSQSVARLTAGITIPASGTTYLEFEHAFQFDYGINGSGQPTAFYDGGQVAYSTTGPAGAYSDLASLPGAAVLNGYNHVVTNYLGSTNPLVGLTAFTAESPGWQTTRVNVSALAGQTVNFEWYIATDGSVGGAGWMVDDVRVYQCGTTPTTTSTTLPPTTPATTTPTTVVPAPTSTVNAPGSLPGSGQLVPLTPCRLLDTRPAPQTVGPRSVRLAAGETYTALVWGISGNCTIPSSASAVVMNLTATGTGGAGFVTAFPCDSPRPNASSLNYGSGQTAGNAVLAKLSATGQLCLFSLAETDLIVDINGYFPAGTAFAPLVPARVLETRAGYSTVDGSFNGVGTRPGGAVLAVQLAGRGGVPTTGATAVAFNLTVVGAQSGGFVTAYPCDSPRPNASSLNYAGGQTVGSSVLAKLSADGTICLYTYGATDLIVDVSGYFLVGSGFGAVVPARILETRPGYTTVDGVSNGVGTAPSGATLQLQVTGRGGIPSSGVGAVALNVTAVGPGVAGYITAFPCDSERPTASNLNYVSGTTVGNSVIAKVSASGTVCLYVYGTTDVVVDVNGWFAQT
jgi:bacillolysin